MNFGRSARRKNNDTDGRAAVDREGVKKILKTRPNDYIYGTQCGQLRRCVVCRRHCFDVIVAIEYRCTKTKRVLSSLSYFIFFSQLTPFIIGIYIDQDIIEPFRERHTDCGEGIRVVPMHTVNYNRMIS